MSGILWWLFRQRQFVKWVNELLNGTTSITVHHKSEPQYSEGPFGPTTLGEFVGMRDVFVARIVLNHQDG